MRPFNMCGVLGNAFRDVEQELQIQFRTLNARQTLYRAGEWIDHAVVLGEGWAFCYRVLSDGRRQILSFVLPGDLVAAHIAFRPVLAYSVQTLTPARVCMINRARLSAHLQADPAALEYLVGLCIGETEEGYDMLADLGRRRAEERIARLILRIRNQLAGRGLIKGETFLFPLRQQHIADAVGLTPIHVNRVLGLFRRAGLIDFSKQTMRILDLKGLARTADMDGALRDAA